MDINGAKALKVRLGLNGAKASPAPVDVDVPADAPPVFHWLGIGRDASKVPTPVTEDDPATRGTSLFRRLGLSFR
jgi:hypothetical protein